MNYSVENFTYIIGVDPGKTTGWAVFTEGGLKQVGESKGTKNFIAWLSEWAIPESILWVVEDYKVRPAKMQGGFQHNWSNVQPARIIGMIEYVSTVYEHGFVLQQPSIKPVGYGQMGGNYKKGKKGMHMQDAAAHVVYYVNKNKPLP